MPELYKVYYLNFYKAFNPIKQIQSVCYSGQLT